MVAFKFRQTISMLPGMTLFTSSRGTETKASPGLIHRCVPMGLSLPRQSGSAAAVPRRCRGSAAAAAGYKSTIMKLEVTWTNS